MLPAWLGCAPVSTFDDALRTVIDRARTAPVDELVGLAAELGLPVATVGSVIPSDPRVTPTWPSAPVKPLADVLVADLTSLWAGPLCGRILADAGATVVKVEGAGRHDGARFGDRDFLDRMNHGKLCYAVDVDSGDLAQLLDVADVVLEASRPRALEQRGLDALRRTPRAGRVWLRITGYDRLTDPNRAAFGDDAAVAGGLIADGRTGPVFCADAIADPLSGLESAAAVLQSLSSGGGDVVDVSMSAVAARYAHAAPPDSVAVTRSIDGGWTTRGVPVTSARRRSEDPPAGIARATGADNRAVTELVRRRRSVLE